MNHNLIPALALTSALLMGCSAESNKGGTPALFNTKAEAEKAAKNFNCKGAHKMGDKWMPCKDHKNNGHHHHDH